MTKKVFIWAFVIMCFLVLCIIYLNGGKALAVKMLQSPKVSIEAQFQNEIIGKWQSDGNLKFVEFFQDNTVIVSNGELQFSGTWKNVSNNRIKIDLIALGTPQAQVLENIEVTKEKLSYEVNGKKLSLKRKK
jgi:hypothetical protein